VVLGVANWKASDRLLAEAKRREDAEVFTVTFENREILPEEIASRVDRS
jgi:nucleoside-triphosphatase THEP1